MGVFMTCCQETKREYELIDAIYDIHETDVIGGIICNALRYDLNWNSFRNIIKNSCSFFAHYYIVVPDTYVARVNTLSTNDTITQVYDFVDSAQQSNLRLLQDIVLSQLRELVRCEYITTIERSQIPQFDAAVSNQSKAVFVHLLPTKEQI